MLSTMKSEFKELDSRVNKSKNKELSHVRKQKKGSSSVPSGSAPSLGNTKCLNCKLLTMKIKILEAKLDIESHPEDHTCQSAAILYEVLNEIENLHVEYYLIGYIVYMVKMYASGGSMNGSNSFNGELEVESVRRTHCNHTAEDDLEVSLPMIPALIGFLLISS
ncbi:hypothetical protein Tco_0640086 [Tanacetum coccineum]